MRTPLPENETERLEALGRYAVMDTRPEAAFDDIAKLAAQVCRTPVAMVNFVDRGRVWSKARIGYPDPDVIRSASFCAHVVAAGAPVFVGDAYVDTRFKLSPLVIQGPRVRFYVGIPLFAPGQLAVGTLCVMDFEPRSLDEAQAASLEALAEQAQTLLEARGDGGEIKSGVAKANRGAEAALAKGDELRRMVMQMPAALWATDRRLRFTAALGSGLATLNMRPSDVIGKTLFEYLGTDDPEFSPIAAHLRALRGERPAPMRWTGWDRTFEVHVEPFRTQKGGVTGSLGMAMDITDRARMERELANAEGKYRAMIDAIRCDTTIDGSAADEPAASSHELIGAGGWPYLGATEVPQIVRIDAAS